MSAALATRSCDRADRETDDPGRAVPGRLGVPGRDVCAPLRSVVVISLPVLLFALSAVVTVPVVAEGPGPSDRGSAHFGSAHFGAAHFGFGKKRLGLSVGYGLGFAPSPDASLVELLPRFGIGVWDLDSGSGAADTWYRGSLELLFDGLLAFNTHPHFGYAIGGGLTLRYNFLVGRHVVPYVDGSFGVVHLDFDLAEQSDGLNFSSGAGAGVHWFVAEHWSLSPEIRWQHISNAGRRLPNEGINVVLFLLGTSYFFD